MTTVVNVLLYAAEAVVFAMFGLLLLIGMLQFIFAFRSKSINHVN